MAFIDAVFALVTSQSGELTLRDFELTAPSFTDDTGDEISGTAGTAIAAVTVPAATGTPTPTYSVDGALPSGLSFNTSTRVISGTPTAPGSGPDQNRRDEQRGGGLLGGRLRFHD